MNRTPCWPVIVALLVAWPARADRTTAEVVEQIADKDTPPAQAARLAVEEARRQGGSALRAIARAANTRAYRLYIDGKLDDALLLAEVAAAVDPTYGMPRYNAARIHARNGNLDGCFRYLEQLRHMGRRQLHRLRQSRKDPGFARAHGDPRFHALFLERAGALTFVKGVARIPDGRLDKGRTYAYLLRGAGCQTLTFDLHSLQGQVAVKLLPPSSPDFSSEAMLDLGPAKDHRQARVLPGPGVYRITLSAPGGAAGYRLKVELSGEPGQTFEAVSRPFIGYGSFSRSDELLAWSRSGVYRYQQVAATPKGPLYRLLPVPPSTKLAGFHGYVRLRQTSDSEYKRGYWIDFYDDMRSVRSHICSSGFWGAN